jgi:hypothetical protein
MANKQKAAAWFPLSHLRVGVALFWWRKRRHSPAHGFARGGLGRNHNGVADGD